MAPLNTLVMLTGTGIVVVYAGVSAAAIVGRITGATAHGHYRMPLFPIAPVLSLLALAAVVAADLTDPDVGRPSLCSSTWPPWRWPPPTTGWCCAGAAAGRCAARAGRCWRPSVRA